MVINGDQARDMLLLYDENGCFGMDVADIHEFVKMDASDAASGLFGCWQQQIGSDQ